MRTISLVIPTYNRRDSISPTLDSVLEQVQGADEIVVVDDGSTDGTAEFLMSAYPMVRVLTKENGGASSARNSGARQGTGDILMFLDSDDLLLPHAVATLRRLLTDFPEARAAFTDHQLRDEADQQFYDRHHGAMRSFDRLLQAPAKRSLGPARLHEGGCLYHALLHGNVLQQPWAIYKEDFEQLGGFDEGIKLCEDWEIYLRIARQLPIVVSDEVISVHCLEGGREHMSRVEGQEQQHLNVLKKHHAIVADDTQARRICRQRIAMYYKTFGDRCVANKDKSGGWANYRRSFRWWSWDAVVAARVMLWAPAGLVGNSRRNASSNNAAVTTSAKN